MSSPLPVPPSELQPLWIIGMFGRSRFPRIEELRYMLTLGPYAFFWFKLRRF